MIPRAPAVYTLTDLNDLCEGLCYAMQGCQDWTFCELYHFYDQDKKANLQNVNQHHWNNAGNLRKSASRELQICCMLFLYSHWSLLCIWPFQRNKSSTCDFESRKSRHVVSLDWKNEVDLLLVLYGSEFWVFIFRFCKHNALCNMNCFQAEFSQDHVNDSKFDFWGFVVAHWKSNCWYISKLLFAHSEYNSKKLDAHAAGHHVLLWNL